MVNVNMLRGKILERGTNVAEVAEKMGIAPATLYRRISNSNTFTIGEAMKIAEILMLSSDEAIAVFFNHKVA